LGARHRLVRSELAGSHRVAAGSFKAITKTEDRMSGYICVEQYMRRKLDGTFTRITSEGRVVVEDVSPDYTPRMCRGWKNQHIEFTYIAWTPAEDERLIELRRNKAAVKFIAYKLGRSVGGVKSRLRILNRDGRVA
jgi:hypothetical protein